MNTDNFYSIDRLVEFGLGIAVAQQMVNSMNHTFANTTIPGTMNPMNSTKVANNYFVILNDKQAGPFSETELSRLISENKVSTLTYVWKPGMLKWETAENVAEVLKIVALSPPPFHPEG